MAVLWGTFRLPAQYRDDPDYEDWRRVVAVEPTGVCRQCLDAFFEDGGEVEVIWIYASVRRTMRAQRISVWEALRLPPAQTKLHERVEWGEPNLRQIIHRNGEHASDYIAATKMLYGVADALEARAKQRDRT